MKCFRDRLMDVQMDRLADMIARQRVDIIVTQRDLETMLCVLAERTVKVKEVV